MAANCLVTVDVPARQSAAAEMEKQILELAKAGKTDEKIASS